MFRQTRFGDSVDVERRVYMVVSDSVGDMDGHRGPALQPVRLMVQRYRFGHAIGETPKAEKVGANLSVRRAE